jgi:hypothetical protein
MIKTIWKFPADFFFFVTFMSAPRVVLTIIVSQDRVIKSIFLRKAENPDLFKAEPAEI